jgi:hypothetical protein
MLQMENPLDTAGVATPTASGPVANPLIPPPLAPLTIATAHPPSWTMVAIPSPGPTETRTASTVVMLTLWQPGAPRTSPLAYLPTPSPRSPWPFSPGDGYGPIADAPTDPGAPPAGIQGPPPDAIVLAPPSLDSVPLNDGPSVPEPSTWLLLLAAAAPVAWWARRSAR